MFHAGGDDVVSGALICKRRSDLRQIVGFGSAGGKEDLLISPLKSSRSPHAAVLI